MKKKFERNESKKMFLLNFLFFLLLLDIKFFKWTLNGIAR